MKSLFYSLIFFVSLTANAEVIHESSYVITVGAGQKYGTYSDKLERTGKELKYTNNVDKIEDGIKVKELVTVVAQDNAELKPTLVFFQKTGEINSLKVDGTLQKNGDMLFNTKINGKDGPQLIRKIGKRVTFASMLPMWIKKNEKSMDKGKKTSVNLILEDDLEHKFKQRLASIMRKTPDAFAFENKAQLYEVEFMNQKSLWWVNDKGEMVKNEYPTSKLLIRKVSPSEAKNFLGQ